jgi:hypothetical protein
LGVNVENPERKYLNRLADREHTVNMGKKEKIEAGQPAMSPANLEE